MRLWTRDIAFQFVLFIYRFTKESNSDAIDNFFVVAYEWFVYETLRYVVNAHRGVNLGLSFSDKQMEFSIFLAFFFVPLATFYP